MRFTLKIYILSLFAANCKLYENYRGCSIACTDPIAIACFQCYAIQIRLKKNYKKSKPFNILSPESGKRKKVNMKTLTKSQVTTIFFFLWKICGETFSPTLEIFMEMPCWCPSRWAPIWRPETSRNISDWLLLQKREFISRRTEKSNNYTLL